MQIRVLGPVDVIGDEGTNVSLGGSIPTRLLALLVAARGEVSVDDLTTELWPGEGRPNDPVASLRTHVARLRSSVGPDAIETRTGAYALGDVETDARQFEELLERARRASGSPMVAGLWEQALELWRGPAFAGIDDADSIRREANRLEELRAEATEAWFDARLAGGEARELAADVDAAIEEFPLREGFRAQQMTVLARAGRQAEALRAFQDFRGDLTEIGLEPSARIVELETEIAAGGVPRSGARRTLRGYELGDRLGEGAFAIVHSATQASVDRPVAIKQIRRELADQPDFIRQFEAEAHLVARLEHPHIVPLYDYWREPGSAYLVMRYLEGGSLGGSLVDGPVALDNLVPMVRQLADGLDEAHRAGVIHRDVKPANILLDNSGNAYLSDFGIAVEEQQRLDPEAWLSNGSPAYAPPEQLRREAVGPPADVHALGVSVFEALTGQLPFPTETTMAGLLERQLHDPIPLVRSSHPDIPAAVDSVIQKATAKAPEDRYGSAIDFAIDLTAAAGLEGDDVLIAPEDRNPYKGLQAFDEADAGDFNGRDRLVTQLVEAVAEHRALLVVGPSGSGKSSAVRAGLLPALRNGAAPRSERWFVTTMIPGSDPFADLGAALLRVAVDPPPDLTGELAADANGISRMLRRLVPDDRELVLVIDQFEELFTLTDPASRERFLDGLVTAVSDEQSRLRIVATLRADFYDHPLRHPAFGKLIREATVSVLPLAADELERAITEPARAVGATFEAGLVARITADVADQPGSLPLLQYALTELFDNRVDQTMTIAAYDELGGVTGALGRRAEEIFDGLGVGEKTEARRVFGRLVSLGEGTEDTRRRILRSELDENKAAASVLTEFGQARLLAFDRDSGSREPTVEVAHEAVIREWPRLNAWLDEDRDGLRIHRHLTETSASWDKGGRPAGELYRGGRLEASEEWSAERGVDLNPTEAAFLAESTGQRDSEIEAEQRSTRRLRRLLAGVAVVAAFAMIASVVAFQQRTQATESADEARTNAARAEEQAAIAEENAELATTNAATAETRRLIADAASLTDENYDIALLLAAEGYRRDPSPASLAGLQRVLVESDNFLGRLGAGTAYLDVMWIDESDSSEIVGLSHDSIDIFNPATGQMVDTIGLPAPPVLWPVAGAAIADTTETGLMAIGLEDGSVFVADIATRETISYQHQTGVSGVAINRNGTRLAIGDFDRELTLVDLESDFPMELWRTNGTFPETTLDDRDYPPELVKGDFFGTFMAEGYRSIVQDHGLRVIAFDQGGDLITALGETRRLNVNTGEVIDEIAAYAEVDGQLVPTSPNYFYLDGDLIGGISLTFLSMLNQDFEVIGSAQVEGGLNVFPTDTVATREGPMTLLNNGQLSTGYRVLNGEVAEGQLTQTAGTNPSGLAIDQAGRTAAISSSNGIVLTALAGDQLLARAVHREGHFDVGVSPDGTLMSAATLGSGRAPSIYDLSETPVRIVTPETDHPLETAFFLPHAPFVFAGVYTEDLVLLDSGDFSTLFDLPSSDFGEAVSPDGSTLVVGRSVFVAERAELVFFDLDTRTETGRVDLSSIAENAQIRSSAFTADSSLLVSATSAGTAITTDPTTLEVINVREPSATEEDSITAVAFSPNGDIAATRNLTGQIDIRDAETLDILFTLEGGTSAAEFLTPGPYFSPDGRYLLTARGALPRLWDLETRTDLGSFPNETLAIGTPGPERLWLTTGVGDNAMIWNLQPETWPEIACQAAGRNLTPEEWDQFGPTDEPYRATCPQWPSLG